jgi:bifunctional NMN adenylyltransferase/nudix hydrolase
VADKAAYDLGVLIGRFQPFHDGHLVLLRQALARASQVLVVIGSAEAARRPDTLPFTAAERQAMIAACLSDEDRRRVRFAALRDLADDDLWNAAVRSAVDEAKAGWGLPATASVALIGCRKDASSYYLEAFPDWTLETMDVQRGGLSAAVLRDLYFAAERSETQAFLADPAQPIPTPVRLWLAAFAERPEYLDMVEEWAFARDYRSRWDAAPYPPVFVTADAVLIHHDAVLLIRRARRPGRGLWALPGGFLDPTEVLADAALRELAEETGIDLDRRTWRRIIGPARVFDAPRRDIRGRTITHAFLIHLPSGAPRPEAKAADDAAEAQWRRLDDLDSATLYGDHYQIIQTFVRQLQQAGA